MDSIIYKRNTKNNKRDIMISAAVMLCSSLAIVYEINNYSYVLATIFAGVFAFALFTIIYSIEVTNGVIVNEKGISTTTNLMGRVKWEHIKRFEVKDALNAEVLVIKIKDEDKLFKEMNIISRVLMKTNIKSLGSPVVIPASEFDEPLHVVMDRMERYMSTLKAA